MQTHIVFLLPSGDAAYLASRGRASRCFGDTMWGSIKYAHRRQSARSCLSPIVGSGRPLAFRTTDFMPLMLHDPVASISSSCPARPESEPRSSCKARLPT